MDTTAWEYRLLTVKPFELPGLQALLNDLGLAGWEVAGVTGSAPAWNTAAQQETVVVLKRPSEQPVDRNRQVAAAPGAWYPDPRGRHELRWWSGSEWTDRVSDAGREAVDPV